MALAYEVDDLGRTVLFSRRVFGRALSALIGKIARYEMDAVLLILSAGIAWFLHYRLRVSRASHLR